MILSFTSDLKPAAACPAAWHAERVAKVHAREPRECFATGSLFHAQLLTPERIPEVYAEYAETGFLTLSRAGKTGAKGEPNAAARQCLADALYVRSLPDVAALLYGAHCETEVRFELAGIPWISHIDLITDIGTILDAKTCRDVTGTEWCPVRKARVPWHESMLYWWQLALYRRAVSPADVPAVGIIACQSFPGSVPDVRVIVLSEDDTPCLDDYAGQIERSMRHEWTSPLTGRTIPAFETMLAVTDSNTLPRCEEPGCAWCRKSRTKPYVTHRIARERGL